MAVSTEAERIHILQDLAIQFLSIQPNGNVFTKKKKKNMYKNFIAAQLIIAQTGNNPNTYR